MSTIKFQPGRIVVTPGIGEQSIGATELVSLYRRHITGDWGDIDAHDRAVNERALREGQRLFSVFTLSNGIKIWVVTEADRSATTFLLPDEY